MIELGSDCLKPAWLHAVQTCPGLQNKTNQCACNSAPTHAVPNADGSPALYCIVLHAFGPAGAGSLSRFGCSHAAWRAAHGTAHGTAGVRRRHALQKELRRERPPLNGKKGVFPFSGCRAAWRAQHTSMHTYIHGWVSGLLRIGHTVSIRGQVRSHRGRGRGRCACMHACACGAMPSNVQRLLGVQAHQVRSPL